MNVKLEKWGCVEDDDYAGGGYWECPLCRAHLSFKAFSILNDMPFCPACGGRVKTEIDAEMEAEK